MRRAIALLPLILLIAAGCGADDDAEPAETESGPEQGAELPEQLQELQDAGIDIELSREDVRTARAAVKEIEKQAASIAGVPDGVTDIDLLPSEEGAEFLFAGGYIARGPFCDAASTVSELDAYGTLDGKVVELDDAAAGKRFAAKFDQAAPEAISDMGETMYNALSVACLNL